MKIHPGWALPTGLGFRSMNYSGKLTIKRQRNTSLPASYIRSKPNAGPANRRVKKLRERSMRRLIIVLALGIIGCSNPSTPAGYVGYVTKHPYTMPARFYELQKGPASAAVGWMLDVTNISVTPNTSAEQFVGPTAVLAKDNLHIEFQAHLLWKVEPE